MYYRVLDRAVSVINLSDDMIRAYAKKITGFAYSRTHDLQLAEDLSQEILMSLSSSLRRHERIEDLDGFVYTICCYTWSKYLRSNKKHWNNLDIDALFDLQDETCVEDEVETRLAIEKLRTEVAYLNRLHREITLLFYYENMTGAEISKLLGIPHSTVRWHLSEIKKKLKAGIEMTTNNLNVAPKRLMVGHDGYTSTEYGQCGLGEDRLVDNICLACYGKKLTIEEIARTLSVAAGYLEHHIRKLVYMDYLRVADKNKYTTNFFIAEIRHNVLRGRYHFHHIGPYAERIFDAFDKRYDRIKGIGFLGSDLDKDFVLWAIIPLAVNMLYYWSLNAVYRENKITIDRPKRKDGSQHWVCATLCDDHYWENQKEFSPEEVDFYHKAEGNGIKSYSDSLGNSALQLDSKATIDTGLHWRDFSVTNLAELTRIAQLIWDGGTPNDMDKQIIAKEAELDYVKMEDGRPKMLIPYFIKEQFAKLNDILDEMYAKLGKEMFTDYIEGFAEEFDKEIPDFISKDERAYLKYKIYPQYAVLYWLADKGLLRYPTPEEAKRLCTVVWRDKSELIIRV